MGSTKLLWPRVIGLFCVGSGLSEDLQKVNLDKVHNITQLDKPRSATPPLLKQSGAGNTSIHNNHANPLKNTKAHNVLTHVQNHQEGYIDPGKL